MYIHLYYKYVFINAMTIAVNTVLFLVDRARKDQFLLHLEYCINKNYFCLEKVNITLAKDGNIIFEIMFF